jgi:DNA-binding response OmpR family regulator
LFENDSHYYRGLPQVQDTRGGLTCASADPLGYSRGVSTVLVFSDDPAVREQVRVALGRVPSAEIGRVEYVECADGKAVMASVDAGGIDVCVLDAEAWPTGGMGLARQIKDEIAEPPAVVLLVARRDDRWLATWSRAEAVVPLPIDPFVLSAAVVDQLRARLTRPVAERAPKPRFGLRPA